jgi:C_GCAxxG_C_C family probable redox protein
MRLDAEAKAYFDGGFNCAQSVLAPFADRFGFDRKTMLRIATPFGGGMGHNGQICGAVSGALMAIGLVRGTDIYDKAQKDACYALAQSFQKRFMAKHGALTCPGLLGLDIGDPAELAQVRALNLFHTRCPDFVGDAVLIVAELLELPFTS